MSITNTAENSQSRPRRSRFNSLAAPVGGESSCGASRVSHWRATGVCSLDYLPGTTNGTLLPTQWWHIRDSPNDPSAPQPPSRVSFIQIHIGNTGGGKERSPLSGRCHGEPSGSEAKQAWVTEEIKAVFFFLCTRLRYYYSQGMRVKTRGGYTPGMAAMRFSISMRVLLQTFSYPSRWRCRGLLLPITLPTYLLFFNGMWHWKLDFSSLLRGLVPDRPGRTSWSRLEFVMMGCVGQSHHLAIDLWAQTRTRERRDRFFGCYHM